MKGETQKKKPHVSYCTNLLAVLQWEAGQSTAGRQKKTESRKYQKDRERKQVRQKWANDRAGAREVQGRQRKESNEERKART